MTLVTKRLESRMGEEWVSDTWGMGVRKISRAFARENQLPDDTGVLVIGVQRGFPAEVAGLARGDIITKINQSPVASLDVRQAGRRRVHGQARADALSRSSGNGASPSLSLSREDLPLSLLAAAGPRGRGRRASDLPTLWAERVKCTSPWSTSTQTELERRPTIAYGTVVDNEGTIILPSAAIDLRISPEADQGLQGLRARRPRGFARRIPRPRRLHRLAFRAGERRGPQPARARDRLRGSAEPPPEVSLARGGLGDRHPQQGRGLHPVHPAEPRGAHPVPPPAHGDCPAGGGRTRASRVRHAGPLRGARGQLVRADLPPVLGRRPRRDADHAGQRRGEQRILRARARCSPTSAGSRRTRSAARLPGWARTGWSPWTARSPHSSSSQSQSGAVVSEVLEGSPAEKAGLKAHDIILGVDGSAATAVQARPRRRRLRGAADRRALAGRHDDPVRPARVEPPRDQGSRSAEEPRLVREADRTVL